MTDSTCPINTLTMHVVRGSCTDIIQMDDELNTVTSVTQNLLGEQNGSQRFFCRVSRKL